jgi:hypothetical protein
MVADVATAGLAGPAFKGVKNIIKVLKWQSIIDHLIKD